MAGTVKERIRDWMRRRFPPETKFVKVYECADVCDLLADSDPNLGLAYREGMLFTSRDLRVPSPRKEVVILTSVLANYSAERIITILDQQVTPGLSAHPRQRLLVDDQLAVSLWGLSSVGGETEEEPCETPPTLNHPV